MQRRFFLLLTITIMLMGCRFTRSNDNQIVVKDPWILAVTNVGDNPSEGSMPVVGGNAAAYMVLINNTDLPDKLLKVEGEIAQAYELHQGEMTEGVMHMQLVDFVEVPAGGGIGLIPGGVHIMLIGIRSELSKGDRVDLVLIFERGGRIPIQAEVREP